MKQGITVHVGNPFREKVLGRANNRKDHIIGSVVKYYGVDIRQHTRKRKILFPRQVAMLMLKDQADMCLVDIGAEFGKNHATVIGAIKRVNDLCDTSPEIKRQVDEIKALLQ